MEAPLSIPPTDGTPTDSHPVWEVYDELRTARMNIEYYLCRRDRMRRLNYFIEYILAATASGSALAAFSVWQTQQGQVVWGVLTAVSALLAIYKPVANLTEKIRRVEKVLPGYYEMEHELKLLASDIRNEQVYDGTHRERYKQVMIQKKELIRMSPGLSERKRLKAKCGKIAVSVYPEQSLYIPTR